MDFLVQRGDGLAILADAFLEGIVLRLDVFASLFGLVDAASQIIVFLPYRLVYLDVVPHVQDMQFLHYHLLLILILAHLLLNPLILLLGLHHSLLQRPGSLIDAPQPVLQLLILLLQLFHSSQDVLDLYIIFKRLVYSLQLHHQTPLQFDIHLEDAIDVLSLMRALEQQIQHYPNDLTDGLLLYDASLVAALHLLALELDQVVLQAGEVGLEVEGEVVEGLEIIGVDPLEEVVEEGRFFELLEVVDDGGGALALALVVYPGQQLR